MKSIATSFALLACAPATFAHTSVVPHIHAGSQTNWTPAIATAAALAALVCILAREIHSAKEKGTPKSKSD